MCWPIEPSLRSDDQEGGRTTLIRYARTLGLWAVLSRCCCACLAPPLCSPAPLPPSAGYAQGDEGEEERRGFRDLLRTTDHGSHERVNIETVDDPVLVHVALGLVRYSQPCWANVLAVRTRDL
jgi:hypothetical protein